MVNNKREEGGMQEARGDGKRRRMNGDDNELGRGRIGAAWSVECGAWRVESPQKREIGAKGDGVTQ